MPPNTEKYTATDLRILDAAVKLFSSHGYRGTTTREIALLAGVSENSLFRHFQHKEGLFWAALESRVAQVNMRSELREGLREQRRPEVVVPHLLEFFSYIAIYQTALIRLLSVAFLELPEKTENLCHSYLAGMFADVSRYLASNAGSRELSALESTLLAAAIVVAPVAHPLYYRLARGANAASLPDAKTRVRAYTHFWLEVLNRSAGRRFDPERESSGEDFPAST